MLVAKLESGSDPGEREAVKMNEHEHPHTPTDPEDAPQRHGMLLFGEAGAYFSHLPMFHRPHDYQAIFEVGLSRTGTDPVTVYVKDRQAHPEFKIYTWSPKTMFVLKDLVSPDPEHPQGGPFVGDIVRGHFERDGSTTILRDVHVSATNVVHFRRFDSQAQGLSRLEYMLFGKVQELFLTHLITKPPDYDQILSVQIPSHEFTDEELRLGISLVFPERANSASERLREGEQAVAEAQLAGEDTTRTQIQVEVGIEYYFEEGELRLSPVFTSTEEEIAAGFP
jgi:hypothetical protein